MTSPTPPEAASPHITPLIVKLASIAVHAEEYLSPSGHPWDAETIKSLLTDPEVRAFLDDKNNAAFLPVKREKPHD